MAATAANLMEKYTEFADETEARVDLFLDDALREISPTDWGADADNAQMLLACHLLCTVGNLDGSAAVEPGVVKKEKVGEVSAEYAVTSSTQASEEDELKTTTYGRLFLRIKRRVFVRRYDTSKSDL